MHKNGEGVHDVRQVPLTMNRILHAIWQGTNGLQLRHHFGNILVQDHVSDFGGLDSRSRLVQYAFDPTQFG